MLNDDMTVEEALRWLEGRACLFCDGTKLQWNLMDAHAAKVLRRSLSERVSIAEPVLSVS